MSSLQKQLQSIMQVLKHEKKNLDKPMPSPNLVLSMAGSFAMAFFGLPFLFFFLIPSLVVYFGYRKFYNIKKEMVNYDYVEVTKPASDLIPIEERKIDIAVFGATGFTGKLVAKYLAKNYYKKVNWVLVGRSQSRLEAVRQSLGETYNDVEIHVVDQNNAQDLKKFLKNVKVVLTTAGPYASFGTKLVGTCVEYGVHYCDITGEVYWVKAMIDKYDNVARQSGSVIIHCAGCDSIPWDMCTYNLVQGIKEKYKTTTKNVIHYDYANGGFSGGTLATGVQSLTKNFQRFKKEPLLKKLGQDEYYQHKFKKQSSFFGYNKIFGDIVTQWALFDGNAAIVRRSNALLNYNEENESFRYEEYQTNSNKFSSFNTVVGQCILGCILLVPLYRKLAYKLFLPHPGQGPSQQVQDNGFLTLRSIGIGSGDDVVTGIINFNKDPGYGATSQMVAECALTQLKHAKEISQNGGIHTPASGLGSKLMKSLQDSGVTFEMKYYGKKDRV